MFEYNTIMQQGWQRFKDICSTKKEKENGGGRGSKKNIVIKIPINNQQQKAKHIPQAS